MVKCTIVGVNPGAEYTELQLASKDPSLTTDRNPAFKGVAVFKINTNNEYLKKQSNGITDWTPLVGTDINCNVRWQYKPDGGHFFYYVTQIQPIIK